MEILKSRSCVKISGEDSVSFLQKLVTNDIEKLNYSYNYLLTNSGRFLFDFFVYKSLDKVQNKNTKDLYIEVESEFVSEFVKKLNLYKLHSKIHITILDANYVYIYSDRQVNNSYSGFEFDRVIHSVKDPRHPKLGFRSLIQLSQDQKLNIPLGQFCLYKSHKYRYGIIDGYLDMIQNKSIAIEFGIDRLNAVSYTKGCYIGQEIISRARYQDSIKKIVCILEIQTNAQDIITGSLQVILNKEGKKIGFLSSMDKNIAIALLKSDYYEANKDSINAEFSNLKCKMQKVSW
jgi:folate-binding protein YgfZ